MDMGPTGGSIACCCWIGWCQEAFCVFHDGHIRYDPLPDQRIAFAMALQCHLYECWGLGYLGKSLHKGSADQG